MRFQLIHARAALHATLAMLALQACGGATRAGGQQPSAAPQPTTSATTPTTTQSVAIRKANSADADFVTGMIAHHAQALVMAGWAPTHGASASVRTLAERIVSGQRDEIVTMQSWLRDHGLPVPEPKPGPVTMTMNGMTHEMMMPGMLTEEQMKKLDAARGAEFDRLFLTFMIQHHQGAVSMVQSLFDTNGAAQEQSIYKMASDVSADQTTEIERMQRMLAH